MVFIAHAYSHTLDMHTQLLSVDSELILASAFIYVPNLSVLAAKVLIGIATIYYTQKRICLNF